MRFLLIIGFILVLQFEAFAWNDTKTHPTLSEKAAELVLGPDFMDTKINGQMARDIIRKGAEQEDDYSLWDIVNARSRNHFYAPNRQDLNKTGWREQELTVGLPTPLWAQNGTFQENKVGGDWAWKKVQNDYFSYLKASEKTVEHDQRKGCA